MASIERRTLRTRKHTHGESVAAFSFFRSLNETARPNRIELQWSEHTQRTTGQRTTERRRTLAQAARFIALQAREGTAFPGCAVALKRPTMGAAEQICPPLRCHSAPRLRAQPDSRAPLPLGSPGEPRKLTGPPFSSRTDRPAGDLTERRTVWHEPAAHKTRVRCFSGTHTLIVHSLAWQQKWSKTTTGWIH